MFPYFDVDLMEYDSQTYSKEFKEKINKSKLDENANQFTTNEEESIFMEN